MSAPLPASEQDFDLTNLRRLERRVRQTKIVVGSVLGVVFVAIGALVLVPGDTNGFDASATIFGAFMWTLAGASIYFLARKSGYSLVRLGFGDGTIHLYYANGRDRVLNMMEPRFGITFYDPSENQHAHGSEREEILLKVHGRGSTTVTREVRDAIVRMAEGRRLKVVTQEESYSGTRNTLISIVTRIGEAENTPGWGETRAIRSA